MLQINISKRAAVVIAVALVLAIPGVAGATHIFADVDDGSVHAAGIEFMKDSGVSIGCQDGTVYCPDDFVTRAQMGTFMYRLSGNDPATDPSVNADQVDDRHANQLVRAAFDFIDSFALVGTSGTALSTDIEAPGAGLLLISASSDVYGEAQDFFSCFITVNGLTLGHSRRSSEINAGDQPEDNCSTDAVYWVLLGDTFTVNFEYTSVAATTIVDESTLTVLYVPFGSDGSVPTIPFIPFGEPGQEHNQ